jgi:hypothetical protein
MASIPLRVLEIPRVLASVEVNIDTLSTGKIQEQYILDAAWGQTQSSAQQNSAWAAGLSFWAINNYMGTVACSFSFVHWSDFYNLVEAHTIHAEEE